MGVSLFINGSSLEIGSASFLKSFFSTIYFHLVTPETKNKYPKLFTDLYNGHVKWEDAQEIQDNLEDIREAFKNFDTDKVVWDIDDLSKSPPWGSDISARVTSMANYFVTSRGKDLFEELFDALARSKEMKEDIYLK
jgi:hypothetical protein